MKSRVVFLLLSTFFLPFIAECTQTAKEPQSVPGQHLHAFEEGGRKTDDVNYLLYLPENYGVDAMAKWPLILFLHGAGERGVDLEKVKTHGLPKLIAEGRQFPFVIVSPQCSEGDQWRSATQLGKLKALLDEIVSRYRIDDDRIYLTGLSMGGYGTWALAIAYPDRFAAIAPICGGGRADQVARISHVPTWVFHGALDTGVPLSRSVTMVDALKKAGGNVKFTVYPNAKHDSWTETYNNPEFYGWFLEQKRTGRK